MTRGICPVHRTACNDRRHFSATRRSAWGTHARSMGNARSGGRAEHGHARGAQARASRMRACLGHGGAPGTVGWVRPVGSDGRVLTRGVSLIKGVLADGNPYQVFGLASFGKFQA